MPAGRPPLPFDENAADQILEAIADGTGLVTFLKQRPDLPSYPTVMRWVRDNPEFSEMYARACEDMADNDADKISDVADQVLQGLVDPQAARVAIDAYKWSAGKRRPRKYGDKVDITQTTTMAVTHTLDVSTLTLEELDVLEKALGGGNG
jgi:hypothetical protein